MSRVLVTGMSGTGKSAALAELGRRGYRVVETDEPGWSEYHEYVDPTDELHRGEWLWVEERITELLDADDGRSLFVEGCVRNQSRFYDRFDAVVLLSAPADVILDRIASRTTNNYGKTPVERAMILDDLAKVEPLLREGCTHELDASRPLAEVVADLDRDRVAPGDDVLGTHDHIDGQGEEGTMSNEEVAPETRGVAVQELATVDLAREIEGMAGRQLRMRMVTIEPGGVFGPIHDHRGRPGTVYILQGTITDHRDGVATDYGPGVGWPEDRNTAHWLENRGTIPAVEISVDIVGQE